MRLKTLSTLFIIASLIGCSPSTKQKNPLDNEINEIVNITFDVTVGSDTIWRKYLLIPNFFIPPGKGKSLSYKAELDKFTKSLDSIKQKLDTSLLYVFISDSLALDQSNKSQLEYLTDLKTFKNNFDIDTSYFHILKKLVNNPSSERLNISNFKNKFKYKIDFISNKNKYSTKIISIGYVQISKPAFNSELTKACIFSEFICGSGCGSGCVMFFKKIQGRWEIEYIKEVWVS
jgi:hypothetical protein